MRTGFGTQAKATREAFATYAVSIAAAIPSLAAVCNCAELGEGVTENCERQRSREPPRPRPMPCLSKQDPAL